MQRCFDWVIALGPVLVVLGCSDPVPASSAVGMTLNLSQTGSCPIMTGIPDDIGARPPNASISDMGTRSYDGEGGLSVSCTVKAAGNGSYTVQANVSSSNNPRLSISFQNGTIQSDGKGEAIVGLSAQALPNQVLSPSASPCSLTVVNPVAEHVKPGAIWTRFNCPTLVDPPNTNCIASGEIVLENCKK